ncbi:hypothetical protein WJX81_005271 [Elliptochloris bilobata]|uniref:Uncharacterized protein n=1 Tax=Elliptochloris bilobata TaxID=381761 RepID=A0AAW1RTI1_9CHLO
MVRACQIEQDISEGVDALLQARAPAQVGLLLGRLGVGQRDFIFHLIKTPSFEDGEEPITVRESGPPFVKKGGKARTASAVVSVKDDWLAEHVSQVARMLPGGVDVVGLYVFCSEAAYARAAPQLCRALDQVPTSEAAPGDLLLLHISSETRKLMARVYARGAGGLRVCEAKYAPALANFERVATRHSYSARVPAVSGAADVRACLHAAANAERVRAAAACHAGALVRADQPVAEALGSGSAILQLLLPLACSAAACEDASQEHSCGVVGRTLLRGEVLGRAYVHKRDPMAVAVDLLKVDLERSLRARIDALVADEEDCTAGDAQADGKEPAPALLQASACASPLARELPRRVFAPVKTGLALCTCVRSEDPEAEALEALREVTGLDVAAEQLEWLEGRSGAPAAAPARWDPLATGPQAGCFGRVFSIAKT